MQFCTQSRKRTNVGHSCLDSRFFKPTGRSMRRPVLFLFFSHFTLWNLFLCWYKATPLYFSQIVFTFFKVKLRLFPAQLQQSFVTIELKQVKTNCWSLPEYKNKNIPTSTFCPLDLGFHDKWFKVWKKNPWNIIR